MSSGNYSYRQDIFSAVEDLCRRFSERVLFYFEGEKISFGEFYESVLKRAVFLQQNGIKEGDAVALMGSNSPDWCSQLLAVISTGAVAVPLDVNLQAVQLPDMLKAAEVKAACVSSEFMDRITAVPVYDMKDSAAETAEGFTPARPDYMSTALMLFTSGTTGTPKMVCLSHMNVLHICMVCTDFEEYTENDVTLALLPLFHVYALEACFLAPLVTGSSIVLVNSLKGPDIMKALGDFPVSIFPAAPVMWELFFRALEAKTGPGTFKHSVFMFFVKHAPVLRKAGLGFLVNKIFLPVHQAFGMKHRFFISGGAPLKKEYFKYFKNMGFSFIEGYGLSETTGPITIPFYKNAEAGSVGKPMPGNEVKILNVNEDGIGEICFRGPAVMSGYYKNPEATREAFDGEGFFNTGDLGRLDKNGELHVTGRLKNVIVLDTGKNVYPEELESYYRKSPRISEIAVIDRVADGKTQVFAVITPVSKAKDEYSRIKEEIEDLNKGLPAYRRVHNFALSMDELPKNSTRKILYRDVKKLLAEGAYQCSENDEAEFRTELKGADIREESIVEFLSGKFKRKLYANERLEDLGVDSLGMIELVTGLEEQFGIQADVKELTGRKNLAEAAAYLACLDAKGGACLDDRILNGEITRKPRKFYNPLYNVFDAVVAFLSRRFWHVKIYNRERLRIDNAVFVANHQSFLDMIWMCFCFPVKYRKNIYVTGKKKFAFIRLLFPIFPVLFLDDSNSMDVLKANADLLRQGKSSLIYPEGTRTPDGKMAPFKSGAAYLAWKLGKKVVPMGINGAYEIWPRSRKLPRLFTKEHGEIYIGEPMDPSLYPSVEAFNKAIEAQVRSMVKRENGAV